MLKQEVKKIFATLHPHKQVVFVPEFDKMGEHQFTFRKEEYFKVDRGRYGKSIQWHKA